MTPDCRTLRPPDSACLCRKDNPAENDAAKISLTCTLVSAGVRLKCPTPEPFDD